MDFDFNFKYNKWFSPGDMYLPHRKVTEGASNRANFVFKVEDPDVFVVGGEDGKLFVVEVGKNIVRDHKLSGNLTHMAVFPGTRCVLVVLNSRIVQRVSLDTFHTVDILSDVLVTCVGSGVLHCEEETPVVYICSADTISTVGIQGKFIMSAELHRSGPTSVRQITDFDVEVFYDHCNTLDVLNSLSLTRWYADVYSDPILDQSFDDILFQRDSHTLLVRSGQKLGRFYNLPINGYVTKGFFCSQNNVAVVMVTNKVNIYDISAETAFRQLIVTGTVTDVAFTDNYCIVTHSNGFNVFKLF